MEFSPTSISLAFERAGVAQWELLSLPSTELAVIVGRSTNEVEAFAQWYAAQLTAPQVRPLNPLPAPDAAVSTGSMALDALLGGGLQRGSVTELSGPATAGKTCLCCQIAEYNAASVVYVTSEDRMTTLQTRMSQIRQARIEADDSDEDSTTEGTNEDSTGDSRVLDPTQFMAVRDLGSLRIVLATLRRRKTPPAIVLVDSLGALSSGLPRTEVAAALGELQLRRRARELGAAVVVVNHVREAGPFRDSRYQQSQHSQYSQHSQGSQFSQSQGSQGSPIQGSPYPRRQENVPTPIAQTPVQAETDYGDHGEYDYATQTMLVEGNAGTVNRLAPKFGMVLAPLVDARLLLARLPGTSREARLVFSRDSEPGSVPLEMGMWGLK